MTAKTPEQLVSVYGDMIIPIGVCTDAQPSRCGRYFQEVFLQTVRKRPVFDSEEHEKGMAAAGDAQLPEKPLAHGMAAVHDTAR